MRGTFANIRIRNELAPGVEGGFTRHLPSDERMTIYEAARRYQAEGVPTIVLAGAEYGSGSSRDWAAKGPLLQGVRAAIAESFERIHRSNLIGMGILPLEFAAGDSRRSLGLDGEELFDIAAGDDLQPGAAVEVVARGGRRRGEALHGGLPHRHPGGAGVLPQRRHPADGAAAHGLLRRGPRMANPNVEPLAQDFAVAARVPDPGRFFFHDPDMTRLDDGALLIAAPEWGRPGRGAGRRLRMLRSSDGGASWEELPSLPFEEGTPFVLDGELYLFAQETCHQDVLIARSGDRGETWSEAVAGPGGAAVEHLHGHAAQARLRLLGHGPGTCRGAPTAAR